MSKVLRNYWVVSALGVAMGFAGCECEEAGPGIGRLSAGFDIDPKALDFGQVPVGAAVQLPLLIRNAGGELALRVCLVADGAGAAASNRCTEISSLEPVDAPFAPVFEGTDAQGNWVVERGDAREMLVRFSPVVEGSFSATLTIVHNAPGSPATVTLSGSGVAPQVGFSETVLDFGKVKLNDRVERVLTLTNGTAFDQPFTISPLATQSVIFGMNVNGQETPHGQALAASIPKNASINVTFWYSPPVEGQHMSNLTVQYCPNCSQVITLQGEGIKPLFELVPSSIDFGSLNEGDTKTEPFIVRNVGNTPLTVFAVQRDTSTPVDFEPVATRPLPIVLQPTQTASAGAVSELVVNVTYTAALPGRRGGLILVRTDAWNDPATSGDDAIGQVTLTGQATGPDINPLPPAVNFGTAAINGTPVMRSLLLENGGNAPLTISAISLNTMSPEFSMGPLPPLPAVVAPGDSVAVALFFAPQDPGLDTARVIVTSDDRDEGTLEVPVQGVGGVPTTCAVTVAPSQLTFGLVERGTSVRLPVEIRNGGAQPCNVSNVRLSGGAEFTIASGGMVGVPIAPGASHRVQIQYAPTAYGMHTTLLEFTTDDPANPNQSVQINGSSAPSDVRVIPNTVDFNVVPVTCRSPIRAITVYNTGSNPVRITRVELDASTTREFELAPFATPATLAAGASTIINLRYHPSDIGADSGVLFIEIDLRGTIQRVAVPLTGEGQLSPTVTDTFQQLPTPQADALFVVDNSCSMSEEQSSLGNNLSAFLQFATQQGIDFQIGVTTTDVDAGREQGRFVERSPYNTRIIRPSTPSAAQVFRTNTSLGTSGSANERGLEAAYLALSDPLINTWNGGFLRPAAALAVIVVSDEEDHSSRAVSFYENFLRNIKGFQNSAMFSMSAIVGTQQPRCTGAGGQAEYGARYIQVAQATGGVVESICNANWGQTLANIGLNSFGLKRQFILSSQPVPSTIAVEVDGVAVPSVTPGGQQRWAYSQATNSVDFQTGSVPQANAVISVTYTVACLP